MIFNLIIKHALNQKFLFVYTVMMKIVARNVLKESIILIILVYNVMKIIF